MKTASDWVEVTSFVFAIDQALDTMRVCVFWIRIEDVLEGVLSALFFDDIRDAGLIIPRLVHWEYTLSLQIGELAGRGWRRVEVYLL